MSGVEIVGMAVNLACFLLAVGWLVESHHRNKAGNKDE